MDSHTVTWCYDAHYMIPDGAEDIVEDGGSVDEKLPDGRYVLTPPSVTFTLKGKRLKMPVVASINDQACDDSYTRDDEESVLEGNAYIKEHAVEVGKEPAEPAKKRSRHDYTEVTMVDRMNTLQQGGMTIYEAFKVYTEELKERGGSD